MNFLLYLHIVGCMRKMYRRGQSQPPECRSTRFEVFGMAVCPDNREKEEGAGQRK